jgi:serine/threonine protein kinase
VGRLLGDPGGFGVTYLSFDQLQEGRVAIKEYMPREVAGRDTDGVSVVPYSFSEAEQFQYGLNRFLREARTLAQFDHANIVGVQDFFEANGTAYLVMDYHEGKPLDVYLDERAEEWMDPEVATEVMLRVLDGLKAVHAEEYLHRDIKPDNVYLTRTGRPILIDFGAARQAMDERSRSLSVVLTEGYAPYEQYREEGDQGPWTDIYGCGATLYRMITGQKPPSAPERNVDDNLSPPHEVNSAVPLALSSAVVEALELKAEDRPSSAAGLQARLRAILEEEKEDERRSSAETEPSRDATRSGSEAQETQTGRGATPQIPPSDERDDQRERGGVSGAGFSLLILTIFLFGAGSVVFYPSVKDLVVAPSTDALLEETRRHLSAGRVVRPSGRNAWATAQQLLERAPENEEVRRLLGRISQQVRAGRRSPPEPVVITDKVSPVRLAAGESFVLEIDVVNRGGGAAYGSISVSFPELTRPDAPSVVEVVSSSNEGGYDVYEVDDKISTADGEIVEAEYLLVEQGGTEPWPAGEKKRLKLRVTPAESRSFQEGRFPVYYRATMEEQTWPSSFKTPVRDQQGWLAKRVVVDVEG